jgi:hypothetical protein
MVDTTDPKYCNGPVSDLIPETGSPELEITPEMIEAGLAVLYESGAIETPILSNDREVVRQIFCRMQEVVRTSHRRISRDRP